MYPTSLTYKVVMYNLGRDRLPSRIIIGNTIITQDDNLQSWKMTRDTQTNNAIIGNTISKSAEIVIVDIEGYSISVGDELTIEIGAQLPARIEWVPMAKLYITKIERDEVKKILTLTCDDCLQKTKDYMIAQLPEQTYPLSLKDYVSAVCTLCGLELSSAVFFNQDLQLEDMPNLSGAETCFNVLGWAAAAALSNAVVDRAGKVAFVSPFQSFSGTELTADNYINFEKNSCYGPINSLVLGRSPQEDNVYSRDEESIALNGLTEYRIDNNPFLDYGEEDKRINTKDILFEKMKGFYFWPFSMPWQGDPAIDVGDRIKITALDGTKYETTYFGDTITYNGGLRMEAKAIGPEASSTNYSYGVSQRDTSHNAEIQTNKVDAQISLLAEKIDKTRTDLETQTSNIIQTADNITMQVEKTVEDLTDLSNLTSTIKTALQLDEHGIAMVFSTIDSNIAAVDEASRNNYNEIQKFIRFDDGYIELGDSESQLTLKITNEKITFNSGEAELAYFQNNKLTVKDVELLSEGHLKLGNFAYIPRSNGNLSFKYVGGGA